MRIGHGYDAHRFGAKRPLILGGVEVAHPEGLVAHSDGDVLLHALCDAFLGAAGLGDIGQHFPDRDPQYKNMDSREFLKQTVQLVLSQGLRPVNVDITVIAQTPRLKPYINAMCETIARVLALPLTRVNIKATTTEGMGFIGREEGLAAHAVTLLEEL